MKINFALAFAFAAFAAPALAQTDAATPAAASAAPSVKRGSMVFTTDGRRVGRIDRVRPESVGIIYNGKYVEVPVTSLTSGEHGLTTSLTRNQLGKN